MNLPNVNSDWFDVVVVVTLAVGAFRGSKRGFSEELLPLIRWLLTLSLAAYASVALGERLRTSTGLPHTLCHLSLYVAVAVLLKWAFSAFQQYVGERLLRADIFGRAEYGLGVVGGALRYAAIVFLSLAVLHGFDTARARRIIKAEKDQETFRGLVATIAVTLHDGILEDSLTGQLVREYATPLLIPPNPPKPPQPASATGGNRAQRPSLGFSPLEFRVNKQAGVKDAG